MTDETAATRRSLFQLIGELPGLFAELVRAEIGAIKEELKRAAIRAGIGIGLLGAAAFLLLLALVVLIIAAIAGLATVLPFWASALIIFGVIVLLAVLLALLGIASLRRSKPDVRTFASIGEDLRTLRGEARRTGPAAERGRDA